MRYDFNKTEKKWRERWLKEKIYEPDLKRARKPARQARGKPFYNLMMFPYPSAEGLHIGGVRTFTGVDVYGRLKRMQGHDVFEPIGLDGFGIHSENYALKIGKHPIEHAKQSEKNFYRQLHSIGNGFAWNEKLETYDPDYYKWTQWIFVQMFKRGLAYRKKQAVNWCPKDKTVLADEQVISGECERCGSKVIKKELEQWFFKITDYAGRLLKNLPKLDWSENIKIAQKNWIGKSEGALIEFPISNFQFPIEVFTTRPDTLFGATYMVLSPEHKLISNLKSQISNRKEVEKYINAAVMKTETERVAEGKEKTGVELKGIKALNPATKEEIPIWVADYVLSGYGTGAIMAVPAHDKRDFEFAKKHQLNIKTVILPAEKEHVVTEAEPYEGEGHLIKSAKFTGEESEKAKWEITKFVSGKRITKFRLRDWLVSRQRYWGPPIPMIYCEKCASTGSAQDGWQPVPEKDLPVKLPFTKKFRPSGTGKSPLASIKSFYETKCPICGGRARRETDVSDTFLDSAWYHLRYPSVHSARSRQVPWDPEITRRWLPVNMYIGGAEHAVLHLLYSRFLAMAFHDMKLLHFDEPFAKFRAHGLITKGGAKMSKSKGNVVNPDEYLEKFGADALRMYLAFLAPFYEGGDFQDRGILGITRFLERVWTFANSSPEKNKKAGKDTSKLLHKTIKKVGEDIEGLRYNTAISALMILLNNFEGHRTSVGKKEWENFLKLLAPFAPFMAEEIWSRFFVNKKSRIRDLRSKSGRHRFESIHLQKWPVYDPKLIIEDKFTLVIQINGKVRDNMEVDAGMGEGEIKKVVMEREKVKNFVGAGNPKRIVYIPKKIINIVV
jgi:leucyl-tRNA synthetase